MSSKYDAFRDGVSKGDFGITGNSDSNEEGGGTITGSGFNTQQHRHQHDMNKGNAGEHNSYYHNKNVAQSTNPSDFFGSNYSTKTEDGKSTSQRDKTSISELNKAFDNKLTCDSKEIHTAAAGEGISQGHRYGKRMSDNYGTQISSMDKEHTEEYDNHHDHRNEDNFTKTSDLYGSNKKPLSAAQTTSITAQQAFDNQFKQTNIAGESFFQGDGYDSYATSDGYKTPISSIDNDNQLTSESRTEEIHSAGEGITQGHRYDNIETSDCYGTQISSMDKEHTVEYDIEHDHRNEDNHTKDSDFYGENKKFPTTTTNYHDNRRNANSTSSKDFFGYDSSVNNEFRKVGEVPEPEKGKTSTTNYYDNRRTAHTTSSSDFYGYDSSVNNEFRKVGEVPETEKDKNAGPEQDSASSDEFNIVNGRKFKIDKSGQWYKDLSPEDSKIDNGRKVQVDNSGEWYKDKSSEEYKIINGRKFKVDNSGQWYKD